MTAVSTRVAGSWINGAAVATAGAAHRVVDPATGDACSRLRAGQRHPLQPRVSQTGKPVRLAAEFDVPGSVDNIDFFAGAARRLEGKASAEYSGGHTSSIRREAVGVVATIAAWNYPLQMAA